MGKPRTLLEQLCEHALSCGTDSIQVEYKDGREWVSVLDGDRGYSVASFEGSSSQAKGLRETLYAASKKPLRSALAGQVWILKVKIYDSFGEDAFRVSIHPVPKLDPSVAPTITKKQGQYLAYIHYYSKIQRRPPAEADIQRYFQTTPPSVHQMINTLELNGFIEKTPGEARSIRVLVPPEHLPKLE